MLQIAAYGRLGRGPEQKTTKTGKIMTTCSVAVDVTGNSENQETLWLQVLAFGKVAESLMKHAKGDLVSLSGRITQSRWTGKDGEDKTALQLIADTVISSRTVKPGGRKKKPPKTQKPGPAEYYAKGGAADLPFNDEISF